MPSSKTKVVICLHIALTIRKQACEPENSE